MKKTKIVLLALFMALVVFHGALSEELIFDDTMITVKEALVLHLGMTKDDLNAAIKTTSELTDTKNNGETFRLDYMINEELCFASVTFDDRGTAVLLQGGVTDRGLREGDTIQRMMDLYGSDPDHETFDNHGRYDVYTYQLGNSVLVVTTYGYNEDYLKSLAKRGTLEQEPIVNSIALHIPGYVMPD